MRRLGAGFAIVLAFSLAGGVTHADLPSNVRGAFRGQYYDDCFNRPTATTGYSTWVQVNLVGQLSLGGEMYRGNINLGRVTHGCPDPHPAVSVPLSGSNVLTGRSVSGDCLATFDIDWVLASDPIGAVFNATFDCTGSVSTAAGEGPLGHAVFALTGTLLPGDYLIQLTECDLVGDCSGPRYRRAGLIGIFARA
jgi:hypothetical protein